MDSPSQEPSPASRDLAPPSEGELALLDELVLPSARGGKRVAAPLQVSVLRELSDEDLPLLLSPPPIGSEFKGPLALRHAHHQLARMIAQGVEQERIALVTGYSTAYISSLKGGSDFQALIDYYAIQVEQIHIDVLQRMKDLGLQTLDELQAEMVEHPEQFTKQQKMDLVEMMLVKPLQIAASSRQAASNNGLAGGAHIRVSFVKAESQGEETMIEINPREQGRKGEDL